MALIVTVYCMNFVIFLCINLKLFFLSFVPLLAPNPGDATENNTTEDKYIRSGTDPILILIVCYCSSSFSSCWDDVLQKRLRLRHFKSDPTDRDEI